MIDTYQGLRRDDQGESLLGGQTRDVLDGAVLRGVARGFAEGFYAHVAWFHVDSHICGRDGEYIFYDTDVPKYSIVVPYMAMGGALPGNSRATEKITTSAKKWCRID